LSKLYQPNPREVLQMVVIQDQGIPPTKCLGMRILFGACPNPVTVGKDSSLS